MDDESDAGVELDEVGSDLDEGVEEDESLSSEDSEDDTDWKAVAEKERERAENYKTALTQKRQLRPKRTPEPAAESEEEDDDESRPATVADIKRVVAEAVVQPSTQKSIDSVLAEKVKDPSKREAVKAIYEGRIRQTGTSDDAIRADIDAALAIADAHKLRKTGEEMARARQQDTTPPLGGSGSDRGSGKKAHKFSDEQVKDLTERATRLGQDPAKFIAAAWKNQSGK